MPTPFYILATGMLLLIAGAWALYLFRKKRRAQPGAAATEKLLGEQLMDRETERSQLARALHDEVDARLNLLHLHLHQLAQKGPEAQLAEMRKLLNETLHASQQLAQQLLPPVLEQLGLAPALEELCEYYREAHAVAIFFQAVGENSQKIHKLVELNVFRILQLVLAERVQHAHAGQIHISLQQARNQTGLAYQDNGYDAQAGAAGLRTQLGIQELHTRLQLIKGSYTWSQDVTKGLQLQLSC